MKKIKWLGVALIAGAFAGCCTHTGVVGIDRKTASESGLEITEFTDNPIYAHIHYSYRNIKDFDEKNVKVRLCYTPMIDYFREMAQYEKEDPMAHNMDWQLMLMASYNFIPLSKHWFIRNADIVERRPGYLKILALDDIGRYEVVYDPKTEETK